MYKPLHYALFNSQKSKQSHILQALAAILSNTSTSILKILNMSINHYENFPVASKLLPKRLRSAVSAIYAFARTADDFADEGNILPSTRLDLLNDFEKQLDAIKHQSTYPQNVHTTLFEHLQKIIFLHELPITPFYDLLSAFKQDVVVSRYQTFADLQNYCQRSANPVGRLMLHLYHAATEQNYQDADAICTALQLINFWQDVAIDWQKDRVYLPKEDMDAFNITTSHIANQAISQDWQSLMHFEVQRSRQLMLKGAPLAKRLPGRIGWELRIVVQGGLRILERIEQVNYNIFTQRPTLTKRDYLVMLYRSFMM